MEIIPNENLPRMAECEPAIIKVQPGKVYSWCTCGLSATQPFCDTAHRNIHPISAVRKPPLILVLASKVKSYIALITQFSVYIFSRKLCIFFIFLLPTILFSILSSLLYMSSTDW